MSIPHAAKAPTIPVTAPKYQDRIPAATGRNPAATKAQHPAAPMIGPTKGFSMALVNRDEATAFGLKVASHLGHVGMRILMLNG
jgi:hypothetical protein